MGIAARRRRRSRGAATSEPVIPLTAEILEARAADGARLALHRITQPAPSLPPVILTHGTFSNALTCMRLARRLAAAGHDCWIAELRGHGQSGHGSTPPGFEAFADLDVPAALARVRAATDGQRPFWVAHSGGGLVLLMHLARVPAARERVRGLVTLGSQATGAGATPTRRVGLYLGWALNAALGRTPGRLLGLGPEDEPAAVMAQWFRWNLRRRWLARDGFDFLAALRDLRLPTLALAGARDFIAPPAGCGVVVDALGSTDKQLVVCGREHGFERDYDHAGLISRDAAREIWPRVEMWLASRSRPPS